MTDINTILQEYHQKFDDQKVRELLENLESMMYERASFFRNLPETNNEQLVEEIDGYWRELDDLGYGSSMHDEIQEFHLL